MDIMTKMSYEKVYNEFSWEKILAGFDWYPDGFNAGHECCDRYSDSDKVAIRFVNSELKESKLTYNDLKRYSNKFANYLTSIGIGKGDRVAAMMSKSPELYSIIVGIWKVGAIYVPLFTAFGPQAVLDRAADAEVKAIVVSSEYRDIISEIQDKISTLKYVIVKSDAEGEKIKRNDVILEDILRRESDKFEPLKMQLDDVCIIQYTSGTTGKPKGAMLSNKVFAAIQPYVMYAVDLKDDDVFFCTADPGWMYGLVTTGFVPLSLGKTILVYQGRYDPKKWLELMEKFRVTNIASTPTAYRGLMALKDQILAYNLVLRRACSAGEPLNPAVINWFKDTFNVRLYDHYGVTETGMNLCTFHALDMEWKIGSIGRPIPGFEIAVLTENNEIKYRNAGGEIIVKINEMTYFKGYWKREDATKSIIYNGWIKTGDLAKIDEDGYFWFIGRADDVIKSAGYRIGPFEIESILIQHKAIVEAAVIGIPDELRGQAIAAFVKLAPGYEPSEELAKDIREFVRNRLGKHLYPRKIFFVEELPHTESGKIKRRELRNIYTNLQGF
jgi:acetyl-CoA synthetase